MDENQSRLLIWMVGGLTVLIAALVFIDPPDEGGDDEDEQDWTPLHEDLSTNQIAAVSFQSGEGSLTIERDAQDAWAITAPDPLPADQEAISDVMREIAGVLCGEPIADALSPQFGLAPPQLSADITLKDGASARLLVGRDAPVGWSSYVVCGDDGVVRPSKSKLSALQFSKDQLRSHVVFSAEGASAQAIAVSGEQQSYTVSRQQDGWYLDDGRRASSTQVDGILAALEGLQPAQFDAPPVNELVASVSVTTEQGEIRLREGQNGSLRTPAQPTPVLLDRSLQELLPAKDDLLAENLFTIDGPETITITKDGAEHIAHRTEDGWDQPWAETILEAPISRQDLAGEEGGMPPEVATITVSSPLVGEQSVTLYADEGSGGVWFRDGSAAPLIALPDAAGKITLSL